MTDGVHLHEHERLLADLHPAWSVLVAGLLQSLMAAVTAGVVLGTAIMALLAAAGMGWMPWIIVVCVLCAAAFFGWRRYVAWQAASLRVTTDRLLFTYPKSLGSRSRLTVRWARKAGDKLEVKSQPSDSSTVTVKWSQYQESMAVRPQFFDVFCGARGLSVRYGSADAEREVCFPGIPFAQDLKHYLDKIESAVRQGSVKDIRGFVLKKRGERGES